MVKSLNKSRKGFTLIEIIVVIAVIIILVLLTVPRLFDYIQKMREEWIVSSIRVFEEAAMTYEIEHGDWPRLTDEPYTVIELEEYASKLFAITGSIVNLDPEGRYYNIDWSKLKTYVTDVPKGDDQYLFILRNPVGEIYYLEGLRVDIDILRGTAGGGESTEDIEDLEESEIPEVPEEPGESEEPEELIPIDVNYFRFDSSTGTITGYEDDGPKDVVIPSEIDGVDVTHIGTDAFYYKTLNSVVISDGVTHIGIWAFGNNELTNVIIPNSVAYIDEGAFADNNITNITIPEGVTHIGEWAFHNNHLIDMTIPDSVIKIGDWAFHTNSLTQITILNNSTYVGYKSFVCNGPNRDSESLSEGDNKAGVWSLMEEGYWERQ